jgi:carotenoid cleavage dioxygenase
VRYDLDSGSAIEHSFGTASAPGGPGEAVFVPSPSGRADESNGWYLAYLFDPARNSSDLVILDASDFGGKPVARISLPRRVPYGFHGNWISA